MKTAVVSEKGQVTIPKALRRRLGLHAGCRLRFEEQGGKLVVTPVDGVDPLAPLVGRGRAQNRDDLLAALRGPAWDPELDPEP